VIKVITLFNVNFIQKNGTKYHINLEVYGEIMPSILFTQNDPMTEDSEMRRYYSADVENETDAKKLVNELLRLSGVEASWVKPTDAQPK
jgi:hypothetical protein